MKKICFVAHEFGHFKGHGGIASYLYQICYLILERFQDFSVVVITPTYDFKCDLLSNPRFSINQLVPGDFYFLGNQVLKILKKEKPDFVECAEYLGLCLESILYKRTNGEELKDTTFITNNHTASRECYEWSTKLPLKLAPFPIKQAYMREKLQMLLSDMNASPSNFLAEYVRKNYNLPEVKVLRHPVKVQTVSKTDNISTVSNEVNISQYQNKFVISCLTRIEGRKNQLGLVKSFISFLRKTNADAVLLLIGNSSIDEITGCDERESVFANIPDEFVNRIQFFDFANEKGKKVFFAISDLTVLASPFENFPVAMTESICMGVPIITSKYCGCFDFMEKTKDYTAFDPFSETDLENKIELFYKLGEIKRREIARQQYESLSELVSPEKSVDQKIFSYKTANSNNKFEERKNKFVILSDFLQHDEYCNEEINLVIGEGFYDKAEVEKLLSHIELISPFPKNSILSTGFENIELSSVNALCNKSLLIIYDIKIIDNSNLYDISNAIASEFHNRNEKLFYSLPFSMKHHDSQRELIFYKKIIDAIFIMNNKLNLEELI